MITSQSQHLFFGAADGCVFPEDGTPLPLRLTAAVHLDDADTELMCGCRAVGEVVRTTYVLDRELSEKQGRWSYVPDADQSDADSEPEAGW